MPKNALAANAVADEAATQRAGIVTQLRDVLAWLDANKEPMAAIHVNQAIEVLDPTTGFTIPDTESLN